MVWFWNKVFLRTQSRPGLLAREQLGYIIGSFNVLIDRLAEACREQGVDVRVGVGVERLERQADTSPRFTLHDTAGSGTDVDLVVSTLPSPLMLRLVPDMPTPYRDTLTSSVYQGAVVVLLELRQQLSGTYWLNIGDARLPFTGIIEHTNLIGPEHYGGAHLVYAGKYLDWDHPWVTMSDEELLDEIEPSLRLVNPAFDRSWITRFWVFKAPAAQPVVSLRYGETLPEHRTPITGLYLANMSQIYPEDRGTNYAVQLGNDIASIVATDIASSRV